jgi:XTP/dITP diphosphohydrolase
VATELRLLLATRSVDKAGEIRRILRGVPDLEIVDLEAAGFPPSAEEDELEPFDTFEANARSKAEYFHRLTGLPTVADDSGLEVDALNGAPGVRSKRFSPEQGLDGEALDEANNRYLMERLKHVAPADRTGRYVCAAVLVRSEGAPIVVRGEAEGRILDAAQGSGGFGYDPYFLDPATGVSFAELPMDEKNLRSHRGGAFRALAERLQERD